MYKKVIALAALMALSSFAQAQTMQEFEQVINRAENFNALMSGNPSATSESKKAVNDIREQLGRDQSIIALIYYSDGKNFQKKAPSLAKALKISDLSKVKQDISKSVLYAKMSCEKGNEVGCTILKGLQKVCDNGNKGVCELLIL